MNEEELAALNAQLTQLLQIQSDATASAKAKLILLNGPLYYSQTTSSSRTKDAHHSTTECCRSTTENHTHHCHLQFSLRIEEYRPASAPPLYRRIFSFFFPRLRQRTRHKGSIDLSEYR